MKRILTSMTILFATALLLMACNDTNNGNDDNAGENKTNNEVQQGNTGKITSIDKKEEKLELDESATDDSNETSSKEKGNEDSTNQSKSEADNPLSEYAADEIEYARVWLQIVENKDLKELRVRHISAGEQVNPYDDDSIDYPEDVISLGGKIMAAGIVTYSGNGDGTINLYNVPSHWPSYKQIDESMEEYTEDIIENTEQIYIDPGDDEEVIKLIEKLDIQS